MRAWAAVALALLTIAAPAAQAARWVQPQDGAVLGAIELVQVEAPPEPTPVLAVDTDAGDKGPGTPLVAAHCDERSCLWQVLLDTRPLAEGPHTLSLAGVAQPPTPLQITVNNMRTVERLALWKDPYNPWPSDVQSGTSQRRLFWVANLGSESRVVQVQAEVDGWSGVQLVEVTTSKSTGRVTSVALEPGRPVQLMLTGDATRDNGRIVLAANTEAASTRLEEPFGDPPAKRIPTPAGFALLLPLAAACLRRRAGRLRAV